MRWRFLNWRIVTVAIGVAVSLWILFFPLGGFDKANRIRIFLVQGPPSMARLGIISKKLALYMDLLTANRGLYQPLARFVIENTKGNDFQPNCRSFAESIAERPEILSTFLFDTLGVIDQIGNVVFTDQDLDTLLDPTISKWIEGDLSTVTRNVFGG